MDGIPKNELFANVASFCASYELSDKLSVFEKGALVAQSPDGFESMDELDEEDKRHLRREITHKWHLPRSLYFTIAICSLGSAIQGWDNTGANGANLSFPEEFGIVDNTWLVGFINAAPGISGLFAAWLADPLNNWWGRRGVIFFTGLFCVFPVLAQAFTQNWWGLLLTRLIMGVGMGIKITTIPIMTSEVVPATIRGGLVMSFQLWVAFGILVGFCSNLIFMDIGRLAWRFQLAAAFAPAIPILIFIWWCPGSFLLFLEADLEDLTLDRISTLATQEVSHQGFLPVLLSPPQHRSHGRARSGKTLPSSPPPYLLTTGQYYAYNQFIVEEEVFGGSTFMTRFTELLTVPRIRRATMGGAIVMTAQQFSGINIMAFYSSTIFAQAGYDAKHTLLASFGFGLVNFVFAFPAIWTIDTFGRRSLLLFTFPNMAWCLVAGGCCFLMPESNAARLPLIAFFVYLFTAFYSPGK